MGATIVEATDPQKVRILNELASLSSLQRTGSNALETQSKVLAQKLGLPWAVVRDVAHAHGWPHPDSMGRSADILQARVEKGPGKAALVSIPGQRSSAPVRPTPAPPKPAEPRPVVAQPAPAVRAAAEPIDTLQALVDAACKSKKASTRNLGARLTSVAQDIRDRVAGEAKAERDKAAAKARAAREREKAKAAKSAEQLEVERLEAQLAAARAKLNGYTTDEGPQIRAWANENGFRVGKVGVLPRSAVQAYRESVKP